jgi:D-aminopeptidase
MSRTPDTNIFHRNLLRDEVLNPFFAAAVEATEEAVINCLVAADTVSGHAGRVATGIPHDRLTAIMRRHGRLHPKRH